MEERTIDYDVSFPSNDQPTAVAEPGEGSFDLVSTPVSPHRTPIVVLLLRVVASVRADQLDPAAGQPFPQGIAVIAPVCDHPLRVFPGTASSLTPNRDLV